MPGRLIAAVRLRRIGLILLLALAAGSLPTRVAPSALRAQATTIALAAPLPGGSAFALLATLDVAGSSATLYGFLTAVQGLAPAALYTDPAAPGAATARFLLFAPLTLDGGATLEGVTVAGGSGTATLALAPTGGATFATPTSFSNGQPIAVATLRLHLILTGDPAGGRAVGGTLEMHQTEAPPFTLDGATVTFGAPDLRATLDLAGREATSPDGGTTTRGIVAGAAIVAAPPSAPATTTPTGPPPDCAAREPWLVGTLGRVARVRTLTGPAEAAQERGELATLDPSALVETATTLGEIAGAQRAAPPPADLTGAQTLLVTALASYQQALTTLAHAIERNDAALLDEARLLLISSADLLDVATTAISDAATACAIRP